MRAQVTVEFLVILIIVTSLFVFVLNNLGGGLIIDRTEIDGRRISDSVAAAVNNVYLLGDGASMSVILPDTLAGGKGYNASIYPTEHLVETRWDGGRYTTPIITGNVSYSELKGEITVTNFEGRIEIA